MAFLTLDRLDKSFGGNPVLRGLSLAVEKGEIVALLGPSGSGKTTALRLIAGFETPDRGRILIENADVTPLPPERRHFGMVFQHYALFPHLTVGENVAFGLAGRSASKEETKRRPQRVAEALALVDLPGFEARRGGGSAGAPRGGGGPPPPPPPRGRGCCSSTSRSRPSIPPCASAPAAS